MQVVNGFDKEDSCCCSVMIRFDYWVTGREGTDYDLKFMAETMSACKGFGRTKLYYCLITDFYGYAHVIKNLEELGLKRVIECKRTKGTYHDGTVLYMYVGDAIDVEARCKKILGEK